jgi:hypothetical protein
MARVLNKRTDEIPPNAIYVGRPSKWGNPYKVGRDGTREEVIVKYAGWLEGMTFNELLDLDELRDKDLVCWCSPLPCHADILLDLASK